MQNQFKFPRESRLLTPLSFTRVFDKAIPAVSQQITLLARHNDLEFPRLGITIPKRKVKTAVQRNRIKRCVRESFRMRAQQLPNIDIIVIAKHGIDDLDNAAIHRLLEKQWKKLAYRCKT